jgi:hypothetical protein
VLRAADLAREHGFDVDLAATRSRLLDGLDATGGVRTATGFAGQATGREAGAPDVRDVLHVAGWVDKSFRYLASRVEGAVPAGTSGAVEVECVFRGKGVRYLETPEAIEVRAGSDVRYRWRKGNDWAEVAEPEFWLK